MYDEVKQIIAFVFNRKGKQQLQESEMYLTISMDLNWCSPKIAKEFVSNAFVLGLLKKEGNEVIPSFDLQNIVIPLGFHPTEEKFYLGNRQQHIEEYKQKNAIDMLIERVQRKTSLEREQIQEKIRMLIEQKQLHIASACAMIARSYDVDINGILPGLKEEILKGNSR